MALAGATYYEIQPWEEKTRKRWLFSAVCFYVVYPLCLFSLLFSLSIKMQIPEKIIYETLAAAVIGLIPLWMGWHCAYKKHGTGLLTWWLVASPLQLLLTIGKLFDEPGNAWLLGAFILDTTVYVWWYKLSLELRKINKGIQLHKRGWREYSEDLQSLKIATSTEALDVTFSALISKWPQFEPVSSNEYACKKSELLKTECHTCSPS